MNFRVLSRHVPSARQLLMVAGMLAISFVPATAQPTASSTGDCRTAAETVVTGEPEGRTWSALIKIRECRAEGGTAIAAAIREHRASRDTAMLSRLGDAAQLLRDGEMFVAALDVLDDAGASPEARISAARTLILGLRPHAQITAAQLTGGNCYGSLPAPHATAARGGNPMPPDFAARARTVSLRVVGDSTVTGPLRVAARCLSIHDAAPFSEPVDAPGYIIVSQRPSIEYLCGNRFRIRNPYPVETDLRYQAEGGGGRGRLMLSARRTRVVSIRGARVRLIDQNGELMSTATNEGRACSP